MKKFAIYCLLALPAFFSCSNDFDIASEWEDIPVIYGILSVSDTAHYIRVEKAFLDPEVSALVIAQNPDSLYYDNVLVELVRLSTGDSYQLTRVDGNEEGYVREDGIFAEAPNYLYKIKANAIGLTGNEEVELRVDRGDDKPVISAKTIVLPLMSLNSNRPPQTINSWSENQPVKVNWNPNSDKTVIFDLDVVFNYQERIESTGEINDKSITWKAFRNFQTDGSDVSITLEVDGDRFFQFVAMNIDEAVPAIRKQTSLDFIVTGGGEEIRDFIAITLANSGITGSQDPPVFSNIEGGRGVFTSITRSEATNIRLGNSALDSLVNGRFTEDLGFIK